MTPRLPDPRRYARAARHPLLEQVSSAPADDGRALVAVIAGMLDRAEDAEIARALTLAPNSAAYARLWQALCAASEGVGEAGEALRTTVFALPLVIVSGARQGATIPGLLRDVDALAHVLRENGALGENRNFGVSAGLTSLETLERLPPSAVRAWRVAAGGARDIPSGSIAIRAGEEVHLRFLLGAAITPAAAPSVIETAANIGSWGLRFSRELGKQLALPGVELLALPRPPAGVLRAVWQGRRAQLDVAFDLFLSNAVRRFRASVGDPVAVISIHEVASGAAELRISLSSPFDDTLLEGFRYPLHPLDDLKALESEIADRLAACRVLDVERIGHVLPEAIGGARYLTPRSAAAALVAARN